ncbi:MAG TPA: hypothetical protein VLL75_21055 [Vicinamibacteria bacterium]|jgi:hypothetical protein|nr:hypothetical protein [Vicinamibacteria bacterium]
MSLRATATPAVLLVPPSASVPAAKGAEEGECGVFVFGPGGPAETVAAAQPDFDALVASIRKQ